METLKCDSCKKYSKTYNTEVQGIGNVCDYCLKKLLDSGVVVRRTYKRGNTYSYRYVLR